MLRNVLALLCTAVFTVVAPGQKLELRPTTPTSCPAVQIRFTAKHADGSPVSSLEASDVKVKFRNGDAETLALKNYSQQKGAEGVTALLLIVPPHADVSDDNVKQLVSSLVKSELRFQAAVLGPDGKMSAFSSEPGALQAELMTTIKRQKQAIRDQRQWVLTEESGFLNLWRVPGRHAILRLMMPENRANNMQKPFFLYETTVDYFASHDEAAVYRLTPPFDVRLAMPAGDASSSPETVVNPYVLQPGMSNLLTDFRQLLTLLPSAPNYATLQQTLRNQAASSSQGQLWADKAFWNRFTGGRAEDSIQTLVADLANDNKASYSLIVHPKFACPGAGFWDVQLAARNPQVHLFAPAQIQMRPYVEAVK